MELWKDIKGYDGRYQVSDMGRVRNASGQILTPKKHNRGYLHVVLFNGGKEPKSFLVHRLVANEFLPKEDGRPFVNHINEDRTDNRAENLEWCTQKENMRKHFSIHKEENNSLGRPVSNLKLVEQVSPNGCTVKVWKFIAEIHRELGYNSTSIKECCEGKRKTAYGYKWRYAIKDITR